MRASADGRGSHGASRQLRSSALTVDFLWAAPDTVVVALRYVRQGLGVEDLRTRWLGTNDTFALLLHVIGSNLIHYRVRRIGSGAGDPGA